MIVDSDQTRDEKIKLFRSNIEKYRDYLKESFNQELDTYKCENIFLELLGKFDKKNIRC